MSERDLIAVLFLCMPLVLCAGVWLGMRIEREQERMRAEARDRTHPMISHPKARNTFAPTPHSPHDE